MFFDDENEKPKMTFDDHTRLGRKFREVFLPYKAPAEIPNTLIVSMAKEFFGLQKKCKAFEDALADLEDSYDEEIYPNPEWVEEELSERDSELAKRIQAQAIRRACKKLRETVLELCDGNGLSKP